MSKMEQRWDGRGSKVDLSSPSGRQLRSRRLGRERDPFVEVDFFRVASAGLGLGMLRALDGLARAQEGGL